jgi:hypothetical protein
MPAKFPAALSPHPSSSISVRFLANAGAAKFFLCRSLKIIGRFTIIAV